MNISSTKELKTSSTNIVIKEIQSKSDNLFLNITDESLTTLLDFTGCYDYEIQYFNEKEEFSGKTYLFNNKAPNLISTRYKKILLIRRN